MNNKDEFPRPAPDIRLTVWEWVFLIVLTAFGVGILTAFLAVVWVIARFLWALAFSSR
jgi:hypothetical protein